MINTKATFELLKIVTLNSVIRNHIDIPSGNQTWLAGKWTIEISDCPINTSIDRGFSGTPCLMKPEGIHTDVTIDSDISICMCIYIYIHMYDMYSDISMYL